MYSRSVCGQWRNENSSKEPVATKEYPLSKQRTGIFFSPLPPLAKWNLRCTMKLSAHLEACLLSIVGTVAAVVYWLDP